MRLVLRPRVDELSTLPRVEGVAALAASPAACSAELMPRRTEPADAQFPGAWSRHGGEVPPPPWWSETEAYIGQLDAFKLTDVFLFPAWGVVVTTGGDVMRLTMEEAAYATSDLSELPFASRRGADTVLDLPEGVPRFDRALLTMPFGARMNYGHFVLDALSSLAALDATGLFGAYPVLVPPLEPWQARHFALMGAEPLVTPAPVVRVGTLVYTGAVHHFLHNPNLNYRDLRDRQLAVLAPKADGPRRLYLSRGRRDRRPMRSEARLVAALRRAGMPLARIGVVAGLPASDAAADLAAWWRQVEQDTADRRVLVDDLLTRWRGEGAMGDSTGTVRVRCACGAEQGARAEQQDAVAGSDDGGRAVVADGFGPGGTAASRCVVEGVSSAGSDDPVVMLRSALAEAARAVDGAGGAGTTTTALCCDGSRVGVLHVGDSRAYLLRDGVLTVLTLDHTWVRSLVEEGRLTPEEAADHPERTRLVRALGTGEPDVHVRSARPGDRYLLCTDGVWSVLDDATLAAVLAPGEAPEVVVGTLLARVRAAGAPDNAACAVVDLVAG